MKRIIYLILAMSFIVMTASTCDKDSSYMYRDIEGNSVVLLGSWGLVEVQYHTAGVIESRQNDPETLMEFREKGRGRTLQIRQDGSRKEMDTFRYEKYRGSITIFTEEEYKEYEEYRNYSDSDSYRSLPGKTYSFKVQDENTIFYQEKITEGSYLVNIFRRY